MCYMKALKHVGVRELRQNLSVYLRRIARGETLGVTDRGRVVALLTPVRHEADPLARLEAAGLVTRATGDLRDLSLRRFKPPPGFDPQKELADVRADRKL
jgi:antitoxin (DNA-binding transcriptional repressor) of toxin-antitoxin stability system